MLVYTIWSDLSFNTDLFINIINQMKKKLPLGPFVAEAYM